MINRNITWLLCCLFLVTLVIQANADLSEDVINRDFPPIYVSIVTHNEEPPQYPDFTVNEPAFWIYREAVVEFADMLFDEGAAYNYQSEWNFLLAATMYDTGTPSTNGKNILRYLKEDLGFEIDPHAHETQYNYADVACLIEELGVPTSSTVGGFIAFPPEDSKLEYLWQPLFGWNYPQFTWQAEILWGGATYMHQNEEMLWVSGVWKPKDDGHFLEHDENAPLPHIGGYAGGWEGLYDLLQKQQDGELEEGKIYTKTIFAPQSRMLNPEYIEGFRAEVQNLETYTQAGLIRWVGLAEVIDIWINEYNSEPNMLPYTDAEEVWVYNPTSGVDLYCHIHRSGDFDSNLTYPGVVLIPGGSGEGTSFDANGQADAFADAGFIVMHFDPDGRGLSTNGGQYTEEDYNGFIQQDGLREVFQYLVDLPETDDDNCGMFSNSYGITMAAGTLARYPTNPHAKFLIDFEGPHNRTVTAQINGGHVPHDTSDAEFWSEREADQFMPSATCYYTRIQTVIDHNPNITDNRHAIALINAATDTIFGGDGVCPWTIANDDIINDPNQVYTIQGPPSWLPEQADHIPYRVNRLEDMANMPPNYVSIGMTPDEEPIVVPPGGYFTFTGILANQTDQPKNADVWVMVDVPGYGLYGPVQRFNNVPLQPEQIISVAGVRQNIPGSVPAGSYNYLAYSGEYPAAIFDSAWFEFTVASEGADRNVDGWVLDGWFSNPDETVPASIELSKNYPNPFNVSTSITFSLPQECHVSLQVYNLMGQKVATPVDGLFEAGQHNVSWDASNYSSGAYFYKLEVGDKVITKRMTLLK